MLSQMAFGIWDLFIVDFSVAQNTGGTKELVVHL